MSTELERMVVVLAGESDKYDNMLDAAVASTKEATDRIKEMLNDTESAWETYRKSIEENMSAEDRARGITTENAKLQRELAEIIKQGQIAFMQESVSVRELNDELERLKEITAAWNIVQERSAQLQDEGIKYNKESDKVIADLNKRHEVAKAALAGLAQEVGNVLKGWSDWILKNEWLDRQLGRLSETWNYVFNAERLTDILGLTESWNDAVAQADKVARLEQVRDRMDEITAGTKEAMDAAEKANKQFGMTGTQRAVDDFTEQVNRPGGIRENFGDAVADERIEAYRHEIESLDEKTKKMEEQKAIGQSIMSDIESMEQATKDSGLDENVKLMKDFNEKLEQANHLSEDQKDMYREEYAQLLKMKEMQESLAKVKNIQDMEKKANLDLQRVGMTDLEKAVADFNVALYENNDLTQEEHDARLKAYEATLKQTEAIKTQQKELEKLKETAKQNREEIDATIEKLGMENANRGKSAGEIAAQEAALKGATKEEQELIKALTDQNEAFKKKEAIVKSLRDPMQEYQDTIKELDELKKTLGDDFSDTDYAKASENAKKKLQRDLADLKEGFGDIFNNGAVRAGTQEFYELLGKVEQQKADPDPLAPKAKDKGVAGGKKPDPGAGDGPPLPPGGLPGGGRERELALLERAVNSLEEMKNKGLGVEIEVGGGLIA